VNKNTTEKLYQKAIELLSPQKDETVLDLYCGIGTITLCAAKHCGKIIGVEVVEEAINDARENAESNGITNAEFYVGTAEEVCPRLVKEGLTANAVIVDPPRKGCDKKLLETIVSLSPSRVVYVSCDPATLSRDAKFLCEHGYNLTQAYPFDQFPHTGHVETVCLLSKLNTKQHIEVDIHMDELDLTDAEKKATYGEIKEYVLEHTGLKVSSLYIAQVKQKYGIIERENYNKPKSEDARQPQCPPDKEKAIKEALLHFGMI
jgi:23S rRNA (uracil1939-C5)-methyltransferase